MITRRRRRRRGKVTAEIVMLQFSILHSAGTGTDLRRLAHWSLIAGGLRGLFGEVGGSNHAERVELGDIFRWGCWWFSY